MTREGRLLTAALLALACGGPPPARAEPRAPTRDAPRAAPSRALGAATANRVRKLWEAAAGGFGRTVAVSRELGRVATSSGAPVRVYDLATGKPSGEVAGCDDAVRGGMAFAGSRLVVTCESGIRVYEGKKLTRGPAPDAHPSKITAAHIAWPRVAAGHYDGVVRIYDLEASTTLEIPVPGPPIDVKSIALTADGSRVVVAWIQGSIWWWNTTAPTESHALVRHSNESDSLAWSADGALLAEEGEPGQTTLWSFASPAAAVTHSRVSNGEWVKRLWFSPDGAWLVRGGSDGLELAEVAGPRRIALDTHGEVEDVALDVESEIIAAIDRDGRLTAWRVR